MNQPLEELKYDTHGNPHTTNEIVNEEEKKEEFKEELKHAKTVDQIVSEKDKEEFDDGQQSNSDNPAWIKSAEKGISEYDNSNIKINK